MTYSINGTTGILAGIGPAFSAYQSTATSIVNSAWTKVLLQSEEFDYGSVYDQSISRFQPNVAGVYLVSGGVSIATNPGVIAAVWKNGQAQEFRRGNQASMSLSGVSTLVYMNGTTDYLELFAFNSAATQNTFTGAPYTYFQANLARVA